MCQYPISDNIHFYDRSLLNYTIQTRCVNTLSRITFISTKVHLQLTKLKEDVSIPYLG